MSGDIPKWEQLAGDDSFITRNAALNTLIIQIAQEPNPHLDEILEKGMDKHPVADKAESILTSLVRKNGEAQAVYMKAVPFRVFDHVGVQLPKLAFPEEGKALVVTESPADLVETAFEFYSSAADQYVEGMENIWRKLQRIPLSPEARAYEAGINALSYLSRVWPRRRRAFAHTIKEIHSTMMEYLFHLAIHNKIDYHSLEFDARQLVRNAYKTAQIIDKKFGLQRSKPNLEKTIRTQLPPYKTVREIDSPLTLEEDPRKMPAETVDMQDSNPYVDAMFGHITDEILTANGETTRTDAEHEPYIDPKAETVIQADTTVPYPPGYIGEADRTKAMELPNPAKPVQKIPDMKPGPRIWQSQAELMEHYFPFLLRDAVDDYPGRPA
ncbi:hypothetical protein KY329_01810, partial [Candidatus Woesearchaeota archaeon]|nr:hypothetical protein [Candidatus Woesearchaeota archaeon]